MIKTAVPIGPTIAVATHMTSEIYQNFLFLKMHQFIQKNPPNIFAAYYENWAFAILCCDSKTKRGRLNFVDPEK